jgi:hypothetical protein
MMLDEPLSGQEVDEFDAFLESAPTPDECMDITALDENGGVLTASAHRARRGVDLIELAARRLSGVI